MRRIEKPISEKRSLTPNDDNIRSTHPAFGQISVSKVNGGRTALYGSDFLHHNTVRLEICTSEHNRNLSHDWYFEKERQIEIEMSEAQWATFVSSFNTTGVPCTLRYVIGDPSGSRPGLPDPDLRREFSNEVGKAFEASLDELEKLRNKIEGSKLPKKTQSDLVDHIRMAIQEIASNVPFVKESFDKHVETSIEKAKTEVNAYMTGEVMRAGLQVLQEKSKLLGYDEKEQDAD